MNNKITKQASLKEERREILSFIKLESLIQDIRFSFRMLMKSPGFTITAVLTLALGIGANTAIFSVFKGILLNSLPFSKPDGIVMIWHRGPEAAGGDRTELALADYIDCRDQNKTFESIGAYRFGGYSLTGVENPEFVQGYNVTTNFFTILGVKPKLGRNFTIDEGRPGSQRVAIISEAFWRKRFASNKQIIGQNITLNDVNHTIIGIMDSSINYPGLVTDLWTNMLIQTPTGRGPYDLTGIARLKPNTSVQQALNDTHSIKSSFDKGNFNFNIQSVNDYIVGDMRPTIIALFVSVTLVLLIATTNVANLILVRASTRVKEVSIRTALGAGRWQIARLLFIENILISGIGGLIGITIAFYGMKILLKFAPEDIPRIDQIKFDGDVLGWTITVSILIGIICSIILIWQISRLKINDSLKDGGRNITEGNAKRYRRNCLVIFEVALTLVLLNAAGLLAKSFFRLQQVDTGVKAERILTMGLVLRGKQYNELQNVRSFYIRLLENIKSIPGIGSTAISSVLPPNITDYSGGFAIEGRPTDPRLPPQITSYYIANPDYFHTLNISLRRGRYFDDSDTEKSTSVIVINETFERSFFQNENPIGKRIKEGDQEQSVWSEIVGVVGDVKYNGIGNDIQPAVYRPLSQNPVGGAILTVKSDIENQLSLIPAIRNKVSSIDKDVPLVDIKTLEQRMSISVAAPRFRAILIILFAVLALLLSAIGIYGIVSFSVTQRINEIGIRMALGAQIRDIWMMVLVFGIKLIIIGITLGIIVSLMLTRMMNNLLYKVSATDPTVFIAIIVFLTLIALVACLIPARRATKVDPLIALRCE